MLNFKGISSMDPDLIDSHSLRAGGAMALKIIHNQKNGTVVL